MKLFSWVWILLSAVALYSAEFTEIENKARLPVLTPSLARAQTAKIRLQNGLEAYLVSDPDVDKSAAALTVRVGSWSEPSDHPGLAHFLEHMLFLGTKKYPSESEYDRFITEHGGHGNAFTANDATSYLFEVETPAFEEALDRFAYFFKEPLFNPSGVARELQAIDQEFAKNLENDNIREIYVLKELADPKHPFHTFSAGNSSTLSSVSQETLKEFYRANYSSNLMRLTVISSLPLEKLKEIVVADFKDVPTLTSPPEVELNAPLYIQQTPQIVYIEPVKDVRTLSLIWDLPARFADMRETKPESIVCYVLGDESKDSLLAQLKREQLAESLQCGSLQLGPHNMLMFVAIELTDLGVKSLNTVLERFFQTLANFKQKGVPSYLFDDVQKIDRLHYQYQNREDAFQTVMKHAGWMSHEKMETYPELSQVIQRFDPKGIQDYINFLTPQNALIDLIAPATLTGVATDRKEVWNGVPYAVRPLAKEVLRTLTEAKPHPAIQLPESNPYLPNHLELVNTPEEQTASSPIVPHPKLLLDTEKGKIYFAGDTRFALPKVGWVLEFKTPEVNEGDPTKIVLAELFVKAVKESLNTLSYPAQAAGLQYELSVEEDGIQLTIDGYSAKAHKLLEEILNHLLHLEPNKERFEIYKDSLLREFQNFAKETPLKQASEALKSILHKRFSTSKEKAQAINSVSFEQYTHYLQNLFNKVYFQGVLYGNLTEKEGKAIVEKLSAAFPKPTYPFKDQPKPEIVVLPENGGPYYIEKEIQGQGNAVILTIEKPEFSFINRAAQQILMQAMGEAFYAELRTKQQTGYIVYTSPEDVEKHLFNFFAVQSNTHDPRDLAARFELFIEGYMQELTTEITEERFNKLREGLLATFQQPAKNIKTMGELLYQIAFKLDADFDWMEKRIQGFKDLKYPDFLQLSKAFMDRQNKRRLALAAKGILPAENQFYYTPLANPEQMRKLSTYSPR